MDMHDYERAMQFERDKGAAYAQGMREVLASPPEPPSLMAAKAELQKALSDLSEAVAALRRVKETRAFLGAIAAGMVDDVLAKHGGA
jgi:hypothetical protein